MNINTTTVIAESPLLPDPPLKEFLLFEKTVSIILVELALQIGIKRLKITVQGEKVHRKLIIYSNAHSTMASSANFLEKEVHNLFKNSLAHDTRKILGFHQKEMKIKLSISQVHFAIFQPYGEISDTEFGA